MKTALMIIDMIQDTFQHPNLSEQKEGLTSKINSAIDWFRANEWPIIWVRQAFKENLSDAFLSMRDANTSVYLENTTGTHWVEGLTPQERELAITKNRFSAFFGTDLMRQLQSLDIGRVCLVGASSHACVKSTAIDAYQHDLRTVVLSDLRRLVSQ